MKRPRRLLLMLRPPVKFQADHLFFCAVFLLGAALGFVTGSLIPDTQKRDLEDYLLTYSRSASFRSTASFPVLLFAYYRVPSSLCLFGLSACGVWAIPFLVAMNAFLLAFSIRCFLDALGRGGVLLAMGAMGIRCLFVLPSVFYLACRCWRYSLRRRKTSPGHDRSDHPALYQLLICGVLLLSGCILDAAVSPRLITLIMDHII